YLNLDKETAHLPRFGFSPEIIDNLLTSDVGPQILTQVLNAQTTAAAADRANLKNSPSPQPQASLGPASGTTQSSPLGLPPLGLPLDLPIDTAAASLPPADLSPSPELLPASPPAPKRPQATYQELRPGQAADPASKLPPPPSTYDIRRQKTEGAFMGVTERELPDGHLVEVHVSGRAAMVGQEVISRPSGHKIYRSFSGQPDSPYSGADLAQEERNRQNLEQIFQK
ncbi:MAG: hypothetical protein ACRCTY_01655, partial [Candidatus Adiutrix sp.]